MPRRTNNRDRLSQHDLITRMCMQIQRTHEARLRRVSMNPSERHEISGVLECELFFLVSGRAGIGRSTLFWDEEMSDGEGVV